jgi:hypothetical protein
MRPNAIVERRAPSPVKGGRMTYFKIEKILMGWLALAAAQMLAGMLIRLQVTPAPRALEWMLVTDLLVAATVGVVAVRCDWVGWKLGATLVAIPLAINLVNLIEGSVFLSHAGIPWRGIMLNLCITYLLVLPLWRYIFSGGEAVSPHYSPLREKSLPGMAWRFVLSDVLYLFLYYAAGAIIFPYVRDFYAMQNVPPAKTIVALQLLLRGPVFVAVCLLLVRMIGLSRWKGALAVGFVFTILSGVVALLPPNPFFPDAVRWVHFGEVVSSNFVFGMLVGLIWGRSGTSVAPQTMQQAA